MRLGIHTIVHIDVLFQRLLVKLYQRETLFAVNLDGTNFKLIGL